MLDKINKVRSILRKELENKPPTHEDVLLISQELDLLIIEYYKKEHNNIESKSQVKC